MNAEKQKFKIVADTNVIISALNFGGKPAEVIFLAQVGIVQLYLSQFILDEIYEVLITKFNWQKSRAGEVLILLQQFAHIVMPIERISLLKDEADNRILECANAGQVDYIVSGDNHLLQLKKYQNIKTVNPKKFLEDVSKIKL